MNTSVILAILELLAGILINLFIGVLARGLFKKDGTGPRIPLRALGIYLIINSISHLFHI